MSVCPSLAKGDKVALNAEDLDKVRFPSDHYHHMEFGPTNAIKASSRISWSIMNVPPKTTSSVGCVINATGGGDDREDLARETGSSALKLYQ
jgi:hypothetical protein